MHTPPSIIHAGSYVCLAVFLLWWSTAIAATGISSSPPHPAQLTPEINAEDLRQHIAYLASEQMEGRLTGTQGEHRATDYVAATFQAIGLIPAGDHGTFFQAFEFTAGVSLAAGNQLTARRSAASPPLRYALDRDWRPLAFSRTGSFAPAPVVFAGYGLVAPAADGFEAYDAFAGLDVAEKWVLVLRYLPEEISPEQRQHLASFAHLRHKAMVARDRGARGIIVVSGPNARVKEPLVELSWETTLAGTSIAALSITDAVAEQWLQRTGHDLKTLQDALDTGTPQQGFPLSDLTLGAAIDIRYEKRVGRNVLACLNAAERAGESLVIIGAHADHLGRGHGTTSLARGEEKGLIHYGADDNASGVGGVLEIAHYLADLKAKGQLPLQRDLLFAAWSGEELGLLGSTHFTRTFGEAPSEPASLAPQVVAYLNMDMIGRLDKTLMLHGVGSSSMWRDEIDRANATIALPISLHDDSYVASDAAAFYLKGVPILNAFTGAHEDYHTPRDTANRINYAGTERIARLMAFLARSLATHPDALDYRAMAQPERPVRRANVRVYLGTIPDYSQAQVSGLKVSGVIQGGPAEQAGVQSGDVIVELAGKAIENIYDYTYTLNVMKAGIPATVVVQRGQERLTLIVTPGSRE
jgi:Peptidase family M28/PDZ domain/PA domain